MSVSTSMSVASPPLPSSSRSSSSGSPPTVNRHRSRPSFAIAYSHPPPPSRMPASTSNAGISAIGPDPKSPIGASTLPNKRPHGSSSQMPNPASSNVVQQQQQQQPPKHFVAPAHPQSHHLHSLPPREKTTRTLILDHTAWRHGRTRFAQGRCELGMKVRFKSEERADGTSRRGRSTDSSKMGGFYIGTASGSGTGFGRTGNFGEPPEVELASSDEEGDESEAGESDGEAIRGMAYGKHYDEKGKVVKRESRLADQMDVDGDDGVGAEFGSDGEPSSRKWPGTRQDPSVAKSLASRANGIEKVLNAMLVQRPSSPPRSPSPPPYSLHSSHSNSQHYQPPPSSQPDSSQSSADASRLLPNGLRLRLALLTLVNDLFEREPSQSLEEPLITTSDNKSTNSSNASSSSKPSASNTVLPPPSLPLQNSLPPELGAFVQISSQPFHVPPTLPSFHTLTLPSSSGGMSTLSPMSASGGFNSASPSSAHPFGGSAARGGPAHVFSWSRPGGTPSPVSPHPNSPRPATPLGATTHEKDNDRPSTSPTLHSFPRITGNFTAPPRQLPSSWSGSTPKLIPAGSKSSGSVVVTRRARGRSRDLFTVGCDASTSAMQTLNANTPTNTYRSNVPTYGYSSSAPTPVPGYPLEKLKKLCPRHLRETCRICEPAAVTRGGSFTRIGAGLLKKQGSLLVRDAPEGSKKHSGSVLADLIPRFLRLSALVAMELGREARGEEPEAANEGQEDVKSEARSVVSTSSTAKASSHAQPTREWFALLCGLLTRAVLEGYVARSWKGAEYVEVLMGVGLGMKGIGTRRTAGGSNNNNDATPAQELPTVEEETDEFEPDEMPGLVDACKTLFTGLVQDASLVADAKEKATRSAEEEYVIEMEERMSEFLAVPHTCPDLATHLTQLSEKYPAEPVERAALRFCEAVAKWRGKPELELYKKLPPRASTKPSTPAPLSIDALLASTPSPVAHRPPIYKYFRIGPLFVPAKPFQRTLKRQRSGIIDQEEREPKKEKVEGDGKKGESVQEVVDVDWVGPYGV